LSFPSGKALVQTVDFFTPVVNDPFRFGQIAAANALSDIYAMGGEPFSAMNIVCFPSKCMPLAILKEVLRGGFSKIKEAGAAMAGGHSVEDSEIKYGLAVSGVTDPGRFATNRGLRPGDMLLLTKPLGTGILATAVKAALPDSDRFEEAIWTVASRLNSVPGRLIREHGLLAATDVTGFGLGGHLLEMSKASGLEVELFAHAAPVIPDAYDLARQGFVPAGSHANRTYFAQGCVVSEDLDPLLLDLVFDAQTSGGLVLAVPEALVDSVSQALTEAGDLAAPIGRVLGQASISGRLHIRP